MSNIAIESEDLENVPLVRMEDVQPSRDRSYEVTRRDSDEESVEEVLGTCVIEDIVYDTEYIVNNDDDSNIGSMVSIKSEEVAEDDDAEMIVPEIVDDIHSEICEYSDEIEDVLEKVQVKNTLNCRANLKTVRVDEIKEDITYEQRIPASSWPTLEILPGGVIQKPDKSNTEECPFDDDFNEEGDMMYACAKCSQSFKFLYCLVKHVKWHEDEAKKLKKVTEEVVQVHSPKTTTCASQSDCKHTTKQNTNKRKVIITMKTNKKKLTKKLKS